MERHNVAVTTLAARIRELHDQDKPFRIYHGSTNSTRPLSFLPDQMVDVSSLRHVIKINRDDRTALVEPNVPMDELVAATLKYGLIPPVVMEFPGITVGGGFAGTGGESSSFRYGLFDRTVNWIEMILANGEVVVASAEDNPDLFRGASGSFGTLGVTTLVELKLLDAKDFVELTYVPVSSAAEALCVLSQKIDDSTVDYLDGILFAQDKGVVCAGRLTDGSNGLRVQRLARARDPWFYMHASEVCDASSATTPTRELIPLVDYLFRYDRGSFWMASYAFRYFITPCNAVTRFLFDPLMRARVMYHALHKSGFSHRYIIQDFALPQCKAKDFIQYIHKTLACYPLWLCPIRQTESGSASLHPHCITHPSSEEEGSGASAEENGSEILINVGVWCPGPTSHKAFVEANRALEHKAYSLDGKKWLYAHAYYTENEFWAIYDRDWYDSLREKYHATSLPNVYEKVRVDLEAGRRSRESPWRIWPIAGVYGVISALLGGGYLLPSSMMRRVGGAFALTLPPLLACYLICHYVDATT
ncbi:hypothetical protein VTO42DRAFT_490 [Malbranchea cinnamomea]